MKIISKDELILDASRGYIKDWFYSNNQKDDLSRPNLDTSLSVFRNEPVLSAAIKAISDEILKNSYIIDTENQRLKKSIEKDLKEKYRFSRLLRQMIYNCVLYNNVFIEIVYKGSVPDEMHILETTEMEIIADEHGEIIAYKQKHQNKDVYFTPDECVHISLDHITTNPWGEVDVQGLYKTVAAKQFLEKFIRELFQYNKFRDAWKLGGASEDQIRHFVDNLKLGRDFTDKELIIESKDIEKIQGKGFEDLDNLVGLLDYYRQQILTHLRVPPIIAGIPDNANRSNSEVQARRSFFTRILAYQEVIAEEITSELFPKMGWKNVDFYFPPLDKRVEKDDIEIIVALKNIGLDDESLIQYVKDIGVQIRPEATIKKPELGSGFGENPFPPSRKPKAKDKEPNRKSGSESSTTESQLEGKSIAFSIGPEDLNDF